MSQLRISAWAIRNPIPISLLFIAMILVGTYAYSRLAVKQFPDIEFPMVIVTVVQPGAAPAEVENQITRPIENSVASLSNIDMLASTVVHGVSTTVVQFEIGYDIEKAMDEVQSRVDRIRAELPREIEAPIISRMEFTDQAIITYAVSAPGMSMEELSWFIDNTLARRLQGLAGVAQINRVGGVNREINIILDPVRMASQGVTAPMINQAITQVSSDAAGGSVSIGGRDQTLRVLGAAVTIDQVRELTIPVGTHAVKLTDVAEVGDGAAEVRNYARLNGRPVVGFEVKKTKESSDVRVEDLIDAELVRMAGQDPAIERAQAAVAKAQEKQKAVDARNTGSGSRAVKAREKAAAAVQAAQARLTTAQAGVNTGVEVKKIFSRVYETRDGYHATLATMLEGMALAALVVFLFLRDWRATLITALAMPASLIPTFGVMMLMGFSLNMITLLALTLVIGILVDDAIVEIENIEKRIHRGFRPFEAALVGADQIGLAVVATTFAIFVVFMPVSFMPGIPGQFFKEFGLTVCVAVLFSLVVARLLTPLMAAYFLTPKPETPRKPLPGYYTRTLTWSLNHRIVTCIIGGLAFFGAIAAAVVFKLPVGLSPESNPSFYGINIEGPPGSTLTDSERAANQVAEIVRRRPETEDVFVQVGVGAINPNSNSMSGPSGGNRALVTAVLKPASKRPSIADIRDDMLDDLAMVPDARVTWAAEGFGTSGPTVYLTSETGEGLDETSRTLQRQMRDLPYLVDPRSTTPPSGPEIVIRPRPDEAARLGVTTQTIAQIARISTVGEVDANIAKLTDGERRIPIRVRLPEEVRTNLPALRAMLVPTSSGQPTALETVADVEFQTGPAQIDRMDRKRQVTINAGVTGGTAAGDAQNAVNNLPIMKNLPKGVAPAVAGEQQAMAELFMGFIIAIFSGVFLVYGVMVLLFGSFFKPVTILSALPLALGGAVIGLLVMGLALDMPSLIGFLMLMGLAAKNSILLVEYAIEREREGHDRRTAILEACTERARPIVMTTLAMMAGMLPTALGIGAGSEFRQPMAVAVIGGLITSTVLSLVIVPVVYEIVDGFEQWLKPKIGKLITPREAPSTGV